MTASICHKTLAECGTMCECCGGKKEHELIVESLDNAEAVCSCGGWFYFACGSRPLSHLEREHWLHVAQTEGE